MLLLLVLSAPAPAGAEPESERGGAVPAELDWLAGTAAFTTGVPAGSVSGDYRNEVERAWFTGGAARGARAAAARRAALELGIHDAGGPARALIAPSSEGGDLGEALLALRLAPDLPIAHLALASVHWRDGARVEALNSVAAALAAVPRNLEASLWLASTLLVLVAGVLVLASLAFIAMAGVAALPRAAHDLGDRVSSVMPGFARAALLASLLLAPVALGEGLLGLALGMFAVGVVYGTSSHRVALGLAAMLLVLGMFPIARAAGRALEMLDADPVAESVLAVRQGIEGPDDISLLRAVESGDLLAAHALAVRARRDGRIDEAVSRYEALRGQQPGDPVIATNLANLYFRGGRVDEAVALYQSASRSLDSPILLFNLSQAHARSFEMELFENAMRRAQQLGPDRVVELSQQADPHFVADLPIPIQAIRLRMFEASHGAGFALALRAPLAPGRLGADWSLLSGVLATLFAVCMLLGARFEHSGACTRCGVRVCIRCDETVWDSDTCDNCHRLFNQPESTDASLRTARVGLLRKREARIEHAARIGTLVLPGVGGLLARRPDLSFLAILLFVWSGAALVWRGGIVPDPLVLGAAGPLLLMSTAILALLGYAALVRTSLSIRRSL